MCRAGKSLLVPAVLFGLAVTDGCIFPELHSDDVKGNDHGVFIPAVRTTFAFPEFTDGSKIELDLASGTGKSSQRIDADNFLALGKFEVEGPADVSAKYRLTTGSLALRTGPRFYDRLSIDIIPGLGFVDLPSI